MPGLCASDAVAAPRPSCPEVSISLVTRDRPLFLEHALELIAKQDYPVDRLEIVLVDSSMPPVKPLLANWPVHAYLGERIRYFHIEPPISIGEKRNFAVRRSEGSIVVQWDDDDYYGPNRLRLQVAPIREGRARCSALLFGLWYFLDQDEFWHGPPADLGYGLNGGHPGTFAFDRSIWSDTDRRLQYPHTNFADPDDFQSAAAELLHASTAEIGSEVDFVYVRHRCAAASCEGDLRLGMEECILGVYFELLGVRSFGGQLTIPVWVSWIRSEASTTSDLLRCLGHLFRRVQLFLWLCLQQSVVFRCVGTEIWTKRYDLLRRKVGQILKIFRRLHETRVKVPARTRELWERVRRLHASPVTIAPTVPCDEPTGRFDHQTADALKVLHKNLGHYSHAEVLHWARGKTLTDGSRKREEIRETFLKQMLPALLTRLAHTPAHFSANTLAHAVLICSRLGDHGGGLALRIAIALEPRLQELTENTVESVSFALTMIKGEMPVLGIVPLPFSKTLWEVVD